jgi:hypothetical protein
MIEQTVTDELGLGKGLSQLAAYIGPAYQIGSKYLSAYLNRIDVPLNVYQAAIKDLLKRNLVENYGWGLICPECEPYQTVTLGTDSSFDPFQMDMVCPKCNKKMDWCLIVRLCDQLREALWYNDGLLALALGWLLRKEGFEYHSRISTRSGECDLIIQGIDNHIGAELKMLWNRNEEKQLHDFTKAVHQISQSTTEISDLHPAVIHNCDNTPWIEIDDQSLDIKINIIPYLEFNKLLDLFIT